MNTIDTLCAYVEELQTHRSELERRIRLLGMREPTRDEMLDALGNMREAFLGGTIRRCCDCDEPVFGGPTRCNRCVGKLEARDEVMRAEKERDEARDRGVGLRAERDYAHGVIAACHKILDDAGLAPNGGASIQVRLAKVVEQKKDLPPEPPFGSLSCDQVIVDALKAKAEAVAKSEGRRMPSLSPLDESTIDALGLAAWQVSSRFAPTSAKSFGDLSDSAREAYRAIGEALYNMGRLQATVDATGQCEPSGVKS